MLRAFEEQGGIFILPNLPGHGTSVFPVSPEGLPHLVISYSMEGNMEDLSSSWVTHYDGDHTFKYDDSH
jgi:hypothetical protein